MLIRGLVTKHPRKHMCEIEALVIRTRYIACLETALDISYYIHHLKTPFDRNPRHGWSNKPSATEDKYSRREGRCSVSHEYRRNAKKQESRRRKNHEYAIRTKLLIHNAGQPQQNCSCLSCEYYTPRFKQRIKEILGGWTVDLASDLMRIHSVFSGKMSINGCIFPFTLCGSSNSACLMRALI